MRDKTHTREQLRSSSVTFILRIYSYMQRENAALLRDLADRAIPTLRFLSIVTLHSDMTTILKTVVEQKWDMTSTYSTLSLAYVRI